MKYRLDFVTNSSSSSFITINIKDKALVDFLQETFGENIPKTDYYETPIYSIEDNDTVSINLYEEDESYLLDEEELPSSTEQLISEAIYSISSESPNFSNKCQNQIKNFVNSFENGDIYTGVNRYGNDSCNGEPSKEEYSCSISNDDEIIITSKVEEELYLQRMLYMVEKNKTEDKQASYSPELQTKAKEITKILDEKYPNTAYYSIEDKELREKVNDFFIDLKKEIENWSIEDGTVEFYYDENNGWSTISTEIEKPLDTLSNKNNLEF